MKRTPRSVIGALAHWRKNVFIRVRSITALLCADSWFAAFRTEGPGNGGVIASNTTMCAVCLSSSNRTATSTVCGRVKYGDSSGFCAVITLRSGCTSVSEKQQKNCHICDTYIVLRYNLSQGPSFPVSFLCIFYRYLPYIVQA
jgi:hypothetical protein